MKFVGTIIAGAMLALFAYYLNQKTPELVYQLSSPITIEQPSGGLPRIVQQIEIANKGNALAPKVQIKTKKALGTITVTKDSEGDNYQELKTADGGTELDYDPLRPAGRVKISVVGGDPLTEQDLDIRYLNGAAKPALTSERTIWSWFPDLPAFALLILYLWLSGKTLYKDSFLSKCKYHPIQALHVKKPIVISHDVWIECLEEAVRRAANRGLSETNDVSSWPIYGLLNSERPKNLPPDVWGTLLPDLVAGFVTRLTSTAQSSSRWSNTEDIRKFLALPRPALVFEETWNKAKTELGAMYIAATVRSVTLYGDAAGSLEALSSVDLDPAERAKFRKILQSLDKAALINEVSESFDPLRTLEQVDLKHLASADARAVKAFANWARYERLIAEIKAMIEGSGLGPTAPREILSEDWVNLKQIETDLVEGRKQNAKMRSELHAQGQEVAKQKDETAGLRAKVTRQLDVINTFLNDPTVVNRIEEYEDVFAPGNLSNLKTLAERLAERAS